MAFRDNSKLITTATSVDMVANGTSDFYDGSAGSTAFIVADGTIGDDTITGFGSDDSIITGKKIFDGNGDGYISFGPNAQLDVDRTSSKNAGEDQISVLGEGNNRVTEIRYLGTKDGGFAYADALTRDQLFGKFARGFDNTQGGGTGGDSSVAGQNVRYDNQVDGTAYDFSNKSAVLLTDNRLGLNFGSDTINGLGDDDLLVFTSKLYDSDNSRIVTFGGNKVLDLSGATGPQSTDPKQGPGGQFDVNEPNQTQVYFLGEKTIGDTTYYYYGTAGAATPAGATGGFHDFGL